MSLVRFFADVHKVYLDVLDRPFNLFVSLVDSKEKK